MRQHRFFSRQSCHWIQNKCYYSFSLIFRLQMEVTELLLFDIKTPPHSNCVIFVLNCLKPTYLLFYVFYIFGLTLVSMLKAFKIDIFVIKHQSFFKALKEMTYLLELYLCFFVNLHIPTGSVHQVSSVQSFTSTIQLNIEQRLCS